MSESLGTTTEFASGGDTGSTSVYRFYLQSLARELLPNNRVQICYRHKLPGRDDVEVLYSPSRKRGHIRGTMKCKLAWTCAVCASYITEQRRVELRAALDNARELYIPVMVTYTGRHHAGEKLHDVLSQMNAAFRAMRSGRWWAQVKSEFSIVGGVRATEITYSQVAGWHPHFHEILLLEAAPITKHGAGELTHVTNALQSHLEPEWIAKLAKQGRGAAAGVALDVRGSDRDVVEYVAKWGHLPLNDGRWGPAEEVTKVAVKTGRRDGSKTPFELLWDYGTGDKRAGRLFVEYAEATKGKSMLQWSRGTKQLLSIDTLSDEQAAEGATEDERLLAIITAQQWRGIIKNNWQSAILHAAHQQDVARIAEICRNAVPEATGGVLRRFYCIPCGADYEVHQTRYGGVVQVCPNCGNEIEQ